MIDSSTPRDKQVLERSQVSSNLCSQGRIERRGHAMPISAIQTSKFLLLLKIVVSGINNYYFWNIRGENGI